MEKKVSRRGFVQLSVAGGALYLAGPGFSALGAGQAGSKLISPGCRGTKVKVARFYMGTSSGLWPKPKLDFKNEIQFYRGEFAKMQDELSDVEFVIDQLVSTPDQIAPLKNKLKDVDGILAIHLSMGTRPALDEILSVGKPTAFFAVPYSGHEWSGFGALQKQELGAKLECMLTTDYSRLAAAVRPFRAIHHLREAKVLNVTTRSFDEYANAMKSKFGTEIRQIERQQVLDAYEAVSDSDAKAETERWIKGAKELVEPSRADVLKSCKLALAFENLLNEQNA
ncbi:MAG: hypothetical protein AAB403_09000, partial [Planctomycetota bacterium]